VDGPVDDPTDLVRRGYDAIAPRFLAWDARLASTTARDLDRLAAELGPADRLLDLGCGPGTKTIELARRCRRIGVDISSAQLALARRIDPSLAAVQADIARPLFRPASFDAAVALFSIIHVPRERQATVLDEVATSLRPGAPLVATLGTRDDPGGVEDDWLGAPMYWSGFDADTNLEMVRRAGFAIESGAIDDVLEDGEPVPFLCVFARRN
jgi:SAM-dependent methyltransferase